MRTIVNVHTPEERLAQRLLGERRARVCLTRLVAVVSMTRTLLTRILPLAGSASWWLTPVCLLPGLLVYVLLLGLLRLTDTAVLSDAMRCALGMAGTWGLSAVMTVLLLMDGAASMTTLVTLFTEGIGTRGTQLTLAVLTGAVLLFCLHREGLPRGIYFLRWPMLLALGILGWEWLGMARLDGLCPPLGNGRSALLAAFRAGFSLAWPLTLLMMKESARPGKRLRPVLPAVLLVVVLALLACLSLPHELLITHHDLSGSLLELTIHLRPAIRTLGICLLMLVLFLAVGGTAQLVTDTVAAPLGRGPAWLPLVLVGFLTLTQCGDIGALWSFLGQCESWLLLPLLLLTLVALLAAAVKRRRA